MKKKQSVIALIIALVVLNVMSTAMPISAIAKETYTYDNFKYEIIDNSVHITGYDYDNVDTSTINELIIPNYINDLPVRQLSKECFYNLRNLNTVVIPDNVFYIRGSAFNAPIENLTIPLSAYCYYSDGNSGNAFVNSNITNVTFTKGNADPVLYSPWSYTDADGYLTTGSCYGNVRNRAWQNVMTVTFEDGIAEIPDGLLKDCKKLSSVKLPSTLKCVGLYKYESNKLTGDFVPVRGDYHYGVFEGCTALSKINLPDSVKQINTKAFYKSGLKEITIGQNVEDIYYSAFGFCNNLTTVNLNAVNLNSLGSQLFINSGIQNVKTPLDLKLKSIGKDISDKLKDVVDNSVYINAENIGSDIFYSQYHENNFNVVLGPNVQAVANNTYLSGISNLYVLGKNTTETDYGYENLIKGCLYSYPDSPIGQKYSAYEQISQQHKNLCEITFDANGGEFGNNGYENGITFIQDEIISNTFVSAKKDGCTYQGLSVNSTSDKTEDLTLDTSKTLYAIYSSNQYTISYDANGGVGDIEQQYVNYGQTVALKDNIFTRPGYDFIGWSSNKNAVTADYTNAQTISNLTNTNGDIVTLYAIWAPVKAIADNTAVYVNDLPPQEVVTDTVVVSATDTTEETDAEMESQQKVTKNDKSKKSPNTGNTTNYILIGVVLIMLGALLFVRERKKR